MVGLENPGRAEGIDLLSGSANNPHMYTLLCVEDDAAIARGVQQGLAAEGFNVLVAPSAESACEILNREGIDLILLDVRLPRMDGFAFCRSVRAQGITIPIIMLTARDEEVDRVMGLEIGADDYIVKPFSLRELAARVRAQLRRSYGELAGDNQGSDGKGDGKRMLTAERLRIDRESLRVYSGDEEVLLTPIEFRLLLTLAERPGITLSRDVIIDQVWGPGYVLEDERTVDVHIRHLREKIEPDPANPVFIVTVRGYGYRFMKKP